MGFRKPVDVPCEVSLYHIRRGERERERENIKSAKALKPLSVLLLLLLKDPGPPPANVTGYQVKKEY